MYFDESIQEDGQPSEYVESDEDIEEYYEDDEQYDDSEAEPETEQEPIEEVPEIGTVGTQSDKKRREKTHVRLRGYIVQNLVNFA